MYNEREKIEGKEFGELRDEGMDIGWKKVRCVIGNGDGLLLSIEGDNGKKREEDLIEWDGNVVVEVRKEGRIKIIEIGKELREKSEERKKERKLVNEIMDERMKIIEMDRGRKREDMVKLMRRIEEIGDLRWFFWKIKRIIIERELKKNKCRWVEGMEGIIKEMGEDEGNWILKIDIGEEDIGRFEEKIKRKEF